MRHKYLYLLVISVSLYLISLSTTDKSFAQSNKEIANTFENFDEDNLQKTILHHESIIAKYPEEIFIPNIMFELAELYVTKAELDFKKDWQRSGKIQGSKNQVLCERRRQ